MKVARPKRMKETLGKRFHFEIVKGRQTSPLYITDGMRSFSGPSIIILIYDFTESLIILNVVGGYYIQAY